MRLSEAFLAGVEKTFRVPGSYFYVAAMPGGLLDVAFCRNGAVTYEELRSVSAGWWARPQGGFDEVRITSSLAQQVVFHIARGDVGVDDILRSSPGNYRGADWEVASGYCFIGRTFQPASATDYSMIQLLNPAGSGIDVFVDEFISSSTTELKRYDVALATNVTNYSNRLFDGAAPVAQIRRDITAAPLGVSLAYSSFSQTPATLRDGGLRPLLLAPGMGVLMHTSAVNTSLSGGVAWREYPR